LEKIFKEKSIIFFKRLKENLDGKKEKIYKKEEEEIIFSFSKKFLIF